MKIRIIIADDNQIDREGVQRILERESDMEVVGVAKTPPEALGLARALHPDVLIIDLKWLPDVAVISSLIKQITSECPETAIFGLTSYPKFTQIAHEAGLKWVLSKNIGKDALIETVRAVYSDKRNINYQFFDDAQIALKRIKIRPIGKDNSTHESDVSIVLDAVFKPNLSNPRLQSRTSDKVQRRDIVFSNTSDSGFWYRMRQQFDADQIIFEVKNVKDISENYFRQIAGYLTPAIGRLGFLITRKPIEKIHLSHVVAIFNHERKLIICLCDEDLEELLRLRLSGHDPVEFLQNYYDELITQP